MTDFNERQYADTHEVALDFWVSGELFRHEDALDIYTDRFAAARGLDPESELVWYARKAAAMPLGRTLKQHTDEDGLPLFIRFEIDGEPHWRSFDHATVDEHRRAVEYQATRVSRETAQWRAMRRRYKAIRKHARNGGTMFRDIRSAVLAELPE